MENAHSLDPATWHVLELIAAHDRRCTGESQQDALLRDRRRRIWTERPEICVTAKRGA